MQCNQLVFEQLHIKYNYGRAYNAAYSTYWYGRYEAIKVRTAVDAGTNTKKNTHTNNLTNEQDKKRLGATTYACVMPTGSRRDVNNTATHTQLTRAICGLLW